MTKNVLDVKTLENWLWEAACKIRGEIDAPKYKDYILPLIFLKRLSDVFQDEIARLGQDYGNNKMVEELLRKDHDLAPFIKGVFLYYAAFACEVPLRYC